MVVKQECEEDQTAHSPLTSHIQGWHYSNPRSLELAQQLHLRFPLPQAGP